MQRKLVVIAGPDKGRSFPLEDGESLVIGRGEASDTQVNDPRMSRVHCQVHVEKGCVVLADAGSSSGTFIEGTRVTQRELMPGVTFQVGDTHLRYEAESPKEKETVVGAAPPPAQPVAGTSTSLKDLVGQSMAHYKLEEIMHKGNTSMMFRAWDTKQNRPAAMKVLDPLVTANEEQQDRFVRAVQTMVDIKHTNLVELYHAGKKGKLCWCAMEYIEGSSIMEIIDLIGIQGMLDWREAYRVAVHIGRALECAYEHKIIHRNITPQNLMQRKGDKVTKLCDLMLAKALEGAHARQVTAPGQMIGDLPYMSPERTRDGADVDIRSDIYGLGATLYALLTGRPPFEADSTPELVRAVREAEPIKPKEIQLSVDERFQDAVLRMLAKTPDDRFQWPSQMLRDLETIGKFHNLDADHSNWV